MAQNAEQLKEAKATFLRRMIWIGVAAVFMVGITLWYFSLGDDPVSPHMVVAAVIGVLLSVVLGSGLMALGFFSEKSGFDDPAIRDHGDDDKTS